MTGSSTALAEQQIFGRYVLHQELASGGMGTVHIGSLVSEAGFSRIVAVKRLHAQYAKDPAFAGAFLDEARLASRIRHSNVVPTLDVVSIDDELLIVMEYMEGESLHTLFKLRGGEPLPTAVLVSIVVGALYGLHAAHEAKSEAGEPLHIVHRDVSPQNILVGVDGIARVLDFGVAKAANRFEQTRDGALKGKIAYMAPEQVTSSAVDRRVDVYAAGAVLWEGVTGRRLFQGANDYQIARLVTSGKVPSPTELGVEIPRELEVCILKALAANPNERYATAHELAEALEAAVRPASARQVSAVLQEVAGASLAARAERVAGIERTLGAAGHGTLSSAKLAATGGLRTTGPIVVSGTVAAGTLTSTGTGSGSKRRAADDAAAPRNPELSRSMNELSGRKQSFALSQGPEKPEPRKPMVLVAAAGALLVVCIGAFVTLGHKAEPAASSAAAAPTGKQAAPSEAPRAAATGSTVADRSGAAAPSMTAAAESAAPAGSSAPAPSALIGGSRLRERVKVLPRTTAPKAPATSAPSCDPPYFLDANGVRRVKVECL